MDFPFNFLDKNSILFTFFVFGLVFSFILIRQGLTHQNQSAKWLSFLLFLCSLYITPHMLGYSGWYGKQPTRDILFFLPLMQVLVIGPVVYFYVLSMVNLNFKFQKRDWLHFLPGILYFLYSAIVFIVDKVVLDEYYFYSDYRDKDLKAWYQALGLISMVCYLILSLKKYLGYKKRIYDVVSFADSILFRWIQNFLLAFLTLLILRVLFFLINPQWEEFGSQFWYFLCFSLVFFYISINGYSHAVKNSVLNINPPLNQNSIQEKTSSSQINLNSEEIELLKNKLLKELLEHEIYTNPQLTLQNVAALLETNSKTISWVINNSFDMNFNDFINHYRVLAVKKKIQQNEHLKNTLLGIALDCGFNSKATFNRAFKKDASITPKGYIDSLK